MDDPYRLERFVDAQNAGGTYDRALEELRRGRKTSHWMWFVFPQIGGLGQSSMSRTFAISGIDEARSFLRHPLLGQRLLECTRVIAASEASTATQIFGDIDARKLRSCMTLFWRAEASDPLFKQVLDRYFDGLPDPGTDQRLGTNPDGTEGVPALSC